MDLSKFNIHQTLSFSFLPFKDDLNYPVRGWHHFRINNCRDSHAIYFSQKSNRVSLGKWIPWFLTNRFPGATQLTATRQTPIRPYFLFLNSLVSILCWFHSQVNLLLQQVQPQTEIKDIDRQRRKSCQKETFYCDIHNFVSNPHWQRLSKASSVMT